MENINEQLNHFFNTHGPIFKKFIPSSNLLLKEGRYFGNNKLFTLVNNIFTWIHQRWFKGCLSLFNCFIDMRPELMSPFFVKKQVFFPSKACFFDKKWTQ